MSLLKKIGLPLALVALLLCALCAFGRGVGLAANGNVWSQIQAYVGGIRHVAVRKTAAFTPDLNENLYTLSTAGGAMLVTLPAVADAADHDYAFILDTAGAAVSFTPSGSAKLDNTTAAYAGMDAVGDSVTVHCDGSNWFFTSRFIH